MDFLTKYYPGIKKRFDLQNIHSLENLLAEQKAKYEYNYKQKPK